MPFSTSNGSPTGGKRIGGSSFKWRNKVLGLAFAIAIAASRFYGRFMLFMHAPNGARLPLPSSLLLTGEQQPQQSACTRGIVRSTAGINSTTSLSLSESIVRKSFRSTYARLAALDCNMTKPAGVCYRELLRLHGGGDNNNSSTDRSIKDEGYALPWWFRTLLRDSAKVTSQWWMLLKSVDPPLRQCALPKVGSKQWSIFMHIMNGDKTRGPDGKNRNNTWNWRGRNDEGPTFVIVRDPLERYLSAFLDKCLDEKKAFQKHCEPLPVFKEAVGREWMKDIKADDRVFFDAYVHSSPLKWNMHLFPQALLCDGLYRTIEEYDFVGRMGPTFPSDLERMGSMFGPKVDAALQEVFKYKEKLKEEAAANSAATANGAEGTETKASSKVARYYTPATVRKVLEYTSIDYVLLNLTIPAWAEEMLQQDEEDAAVGLSR